MKVLITGAAGLYGVNLIDLLVKDKDVEKVYGVDNFSRNKLSDSKNSFSEDPFFKSDEFDKKFELIREDYGSLTSEFIDSLGVDAIVHLAAFVSIDESMIEPEAYFRNNEEATFKFAHQIFKTKTKPFLLYASSPEVYGNPVYTPMDENHPARPRSIYAVSKLACEKHCMALWEWYKYPVAVIRNFNTFGENQNVWKYSAAIPAFISKALRDEEFYITGNGSQTRDFLYVKDAVRAYILALKKRDKLAGEILNIGTGKQTSIRELAEKIIKYSGSKSKIVFKGQRGGDLNALEADVKKIKSVLDWEPAVGLDEGLKNTIEWYKKHM